MKKKFNHAKAAGRRDTKPCLTGAAAGIAAALLLISLMALLIYRGYMKQGYWKLSYYFIPGMATFASAVTAGLLSKRKRVLSAFLAAGMLLCLFLVISLLLTGRIGKETWLGLLIGAGCAVLSASVCAVQKRTVY